MHSHVGKDEEVSTRPLLEEGMDTFIRSDTQISVLHKVRGKREKTLDICLNAGRFYGFHTKIEWNKAKTEGTIQTADGKSSIPMHSRPTNDNDVKVYIHGGECWLPRYDIPKNADKVGKYKVIIPRSGNPGGSILGRPKLSEPNSCSSNTYVVFLPTDHDMTLNEANNVITYLKTRFVRYLIATKTSTQDMPPRAYGFVPVQDFSQTWDDAALYKKYSLTDKEITAIEELIPVME